MPKKLSLRFGWLLMTACFLFCSPQKGFAQDFLKKFKSVDEKNLPAFVEAWAEWSDDLVLRAKADLTNTLTAKVAADLTKESSYVRDYNAKGRYTVLQTDLSIRLHSQELGKRRPTDSNFKDDVVEEHSIIPYVESEKPILYLNADIAKKLDDFIKKGEGRTREEMVKDYFYIVADTGGYHFCTAPYIGAFEIFPDCTVVFCRKGWGEGQWTRYDMTWKKGKSLGEFIR